MVDDVQKRSMRVILLGITLLFAACGDDATPGLDMSVACAGHPSTGAADKHCYDDGGAHFVTVDPSQCTAAGGSTADYGETMYGLTANDDDCKYAVSYTVDPICRNAGTYFIVTLKDATTGVAVPMAKTRAEVFLGDTHPAPNSGATFVESPAGVYKVGPIVFDAAGTWTVRFHFFEDCNDSETSPHGHAAFFMDVP
jgi:hypothetical protein